MPAKEKIIWVVNYDSVMDFLGKAVAVGATGVAIRTDNNVETAISMFHDENIKVFGWRWPSAQRDAAMHEADKSASLISKGLDGYFVDPEGAPGQPYDWDQRGLEQLADDFCKTVTEADENAAFGVTSHYRADAVFPHLPWASFFEYATVLLPQSYWKSSSGTIGHGIPSDNYAKGIQFWKNAGGAEAKILPMGGELGSSTAQNIAEYATAAKAHDIGTLHFYAYSPAVLPAVWDAVTTA